MFRVVSLGLLITPVLLGLSAVASHAAPDFDPATANVACVAEGEKASSQDIDAFLANPQKLLSDNPGGGLGLSNTVKVLASSSSKAYASIIALSSGASDAQKSALGAGLGRAFTECRDSQPDYAQRIQGDVAAQKGSSLFVAYAGANADTVVASVGAPGASSAAQGGGETGAGTSQRSAANNRQNASGNPTPNTAGSTDTNGDIGLVEGASSSP